jgi:hypothetical protein
MPPSAPPSNSAAHSTAIAGPASSTASSQPRPTAARSTRSGPLPFRAPSRRRTLDSIQLRHRSRPAAVPRRMVCRLLLSAVRTGPTLGAAAE